MVENSFIQRKREYQRTWMRNRRAEYFNGKSCNHCGSSRELELDHVDPSKKVSHKIWSWSAERREAELAKCQVLCSDCHLEKTLSERPKPVHGSSAMYRHHGCKCDTCRAGQRDRAREYRARKKLEQQDEIDQMIRSGYKRATNLDWLDDALDKIA